MRHKSYEHFVLLDIFAYSTNQPNLPSSLPASLLPYPSNTLSTVLDGKLCCNELLILL